MTRLSRSLLKLLAVGLVCSLAVMRLQAQSSQTPAGQRDLFAAQPVRLAAAQAAAPPRMLPTASEVAEAVRPAATNDWDYDPTSIYDAKGVDVPRGFVAGAPDEAIDPFSGNLVLYHTDLHLAGVAGLDLTLMRVYNSKIHRNYAARATNDPSRVALGMLFVPQSPLGLGWTMHLGRLVGAVQGGPNQNLAVPRYYEKPDGSQHPFFTYSGPGCGNETTDVCLRTKEKDNPYWLADGTWRVGTTDGRIITFGHSAPDGSSVVRYATEIRDIHGNTIQIAYHDDTIPGIAYQRDYFRHFIDTIVDSAGRLVQFGYSEVTPGVVRLTSITAVGRTFTYAYSAEEPWPGLQAFLVRAQPPEGAPWRYDYAGLYDGSCADNSQRWCELTEITYPHGATIAYTYADHTFYAQTNPMAVRAVAQRDVGGRQVTPGTWTYTYNRAANYVGTEHTIVNRPDNTAEVYTYFGIGDGQYRPLGSAWKAGALLRREIRAADGTVMQAETFDWQAGPSVSDESWGDPWIGFDIGVFVAQLHEHQVQRGNLVWTTTHTSYNQIENLPRCTVEEAADGTRRYRLRDYYVADTTVMSDTFRIRNLPALDLLSYNDPGTTYCDDTYSGSVAANTYDEVEQREYNAEGQLATQVTNGVRTDFTYHADGTLKDEILYQGNNGGTPTDGFCTAYRNYYVGVAQRIEYGAPAPDCTAPIYAVDRGVNNDGSLASSTNGRGYTTTFDYDDLGRITEIGPPGDDPIVVTYDGGSSRFATNRLVTQGSYQLAERFDGLARVIESQNAAGVRAWRSYDALGRTTFQSLPSYAANNGAGDAYAYDALGRVTAVTHADNTTINFAYGVDEHTVTRTDELGRPTVLTYRGFSDPDDAWLVRVQLPGEPAPTQDTYLYRVGGHIWIINYAGRQRSVGHNFAKKVTVQSTPEQGAVFWGYDAAGNLRCYDRSTPAACSDTNWNDPAADIGYTVDGLGRVTQVDYETPDMDDVAFAYDAADNLISLSDGIGVHTYDYTPANRLAQQTSLIDGVQYTTNYTYDSRGNLATLTYPSGRVITYGHDAGNRVTSVSGFVSDVRYHPSSVPSQLTYANGVVTTLSLDDRQRPDVLQAPGVLDIDYDYDAVGNVAQLTDGIDPNQGTAFGYDDLDRLTDASGPWGSLAYIYNAAGDRLSEFLDGAATTYSYDVWGHLDALSGRVNLDYQFDTFGNLTQRGSFNYTYDTEDRMVGVADDQSNPIVGYGYDGQGRRRRVERPGCNSAVIHHYDQHGRRIAETTGQGLVLTEYVVMPGRTVAEIDLTPVRALTGAVDFGTLPKGLGQVQASRAVTLTNRANVPITVDAVSLSTANFSTDAALPLSIPAGGDVAIPVHFGANELNDFNGTLALCLEDGLQINVALRARTVYGGNAPNSHTAPPDTDVVYGYGEAVDPNSVDPQTFAIFGMFSGKLPGTYAVEGGQIKFTPNLPFKPGERVYATATTGVRYAGGGGPGSPQTWQFQVAPSAAGAGYFLDSGQALGASGLRYGPVALGDLDGDGDLDAFQVLPRWAASPVVWFNDGSGGFTDSGQHLGDRGGEAVALADLDADGDLDAFVAQIGYPNEVWVNDGAGNLGGPIALGTDELNLTVALGDLDGDGDLDAFLGNWGPNTVWFNDGSGNFADSGQALRRYSGSGIFKTHAVALGDLDGDGDLDAYVGNSYSSSNQPEWNQGWLDTIWINDGSGQFTTSWPAGWYRVSGSAAMGDLDVDGDLDIVVATSTTLVARYNQGYGTSYNSQELRYPDDDAFAVGYTVALGDVDADGDLDILLGTADGFDVWLNDGTGQFPEVRSASDTPKIYAALGNLDGDGGLDAFLVNGYNPNQVWLNRPGASGVPAACAPDANGDGVVNVVDIQMRALNAACLPYLGTISGHWQEPAGSGP